MTHRRRDTRTPSLVERNLAPELRSDRVPERPRCHERALRAAVIWTTQSVVSHVADVATTALLVRRSAMTDLLAEAASGAEADDGLRDLGLRPPSADRAGHGEERAESRQRHRAALRDLLRYPFPAPRENHGGLLRAQARACCDVVHDPT